MPWVSFTCNVNSSCQRLCLGGHAPAGMPVLLLSPPRCRHDARDFASALTCVLNGACVLGIERLLDLDGYVPPPTCVPLLMCCRLVVQLHRSQVNRSIQALDQAGSDHQLQLAGAHCSQQNATRAQKAGPCGAFFRDERPFHSRFWPK